jgi:hypothetical protein
MINLRPSCFLTYLFVEFEDLLLAFNSCTMQTSMGRMISCHFNTTQVVAEVVAEVVVVVVLLILPHSISQVFTEIRFQQVK